EIGRGGLGRVLRAQDRYLGRAVAIKLPLRDDKLVRDRFLHEVLITARLQHPSIVPLYEAGTWPSGEPVDVMKLVEGRGLHHAMAEAHSLDERLALLPNVIAVAEATAYAHSQAIVHRDLKPDNVLLGAFGETVVLDWGLAHDLSADGESDGQVMGTPRYMAPE